MAPTAGLTSLSLSRSLGVAEVVMIRSGYAGPAETAGVDRVSDSFRIAACPARCGGKLSKCVAGSG